MKRLIAIMTSSFFFHSRVSALKKYKQNVNNRLLILTNERFAFIIFMLGRHYVIVQTRLSCFVQPKLS